MTICSILTGLFNSQVPILDFEQQRVHKEKFSSLYEAKAAEVELENPSKKKKENPFSDQLNRVSRVDPSNLRSDQ